MGALRRSGDSWDPATPMREALATWVVQGDRNAAASRDDMQGAHPALSWNRTCGEEPRAEGDPSGCCGAWSALSPSPSMSAPSPRGTAPSWLQLPLCWFPAATARALPHCAQPFLQPEALRFAGPGGSVLAARREGGGEPLRAGKSVGTWGAKGECEPSSGLQGTHHPKSPSSSHGY